MIVLTRLACAAAAIVTLGLMTSGCSAPYSNDPSFTESAPSGSTSAAPHTGVRAPAKEPVGTGGG